MPHIHGRLLDARTNQGAPDLQVEAIYRLGGQQELLKQTTTSGAAGAFTLEFSQEIFTNVAPNVAIRVSFQVSRNGRPLSSTGEIPRLDPAGHQIPILVQMPDNDEEPEDAFRVQGTITHADERPVAGVLVEAFDRDMRYEQMLGEAPTDAQGFYAIPYTRDQFRRAEKERADLVIRVQDENGNEVAASDIVFNAEPVQTIDLTLSENQRLGPSEYERNRQEAAQVSELVRPEEWTDDDLRFLTGETGISAEHLRFLHIDARWGNEHDIDQAVFYGLFRQGLPTNFRRLLAEKPFRLREVLKASLSQNIIPAALEDTLDPMLERLQELAVEVAFEQDDEAEAPPLGVVLRTAPGLSEEQQAQVVRFTLRYEANGQDDFWEKLQEETELSDEAVRAVQFTLQSSVLTLNHLPVLQQVQEETQERSVKVVAGWSEADWRGVVERTSTNGGSLPPGFESAAEYARAIVQNVEAYLPSDRLFAHAQRTAQDLPVEAGSPLFNLYAPLGLEAIFDDPDLTDAAKEAQVGQRIQQFDRFRERNPALDLRYADLLQDRYFVRGEPVDVDWSNIPEADRPQIRRQVMAFQRLMPIAANAEARLNLLAAGYDSSYKIATTSTERIATDTQLSPERTAELRRGALDQVMRGEVARYGIGGVLLDVPLRVDNTDSAVSEAFRDLVDVEQLFGIQSVCDCPHCNSVLGQSAYFVDLMAFVDEHVSQNESIFGPAGDPRRGSPLYLTERRPDLWQLELSCDTIHTQIPYLQVVNHIFEAFLIGHFGVGDRDVLYQELAEARSTFNQPFLPAVEELRLYLTHFRLTRADVYRVLGRPAREYRLAYLQVVPVEFNIIGRADTNESRVRRLYGLDTGDPVEISMPHFMQATGLERKTVTRLLQGGSLFGHSMRVEREPVEGSLGQQFEEKITTSDAATALADLDRIHRWIRLWRKTGWKLPAFDFVLGRLHQAGLAAVIDEAAVHRLADLKVLQDRLKLTVEELVSLFHLIPAPAASTPDPGALFFEESGILYHRLFGRELFPAGREVIFHDFETEHPTVELPYPEAYRLLAGLSLSETDVVELLIQLRHDLDIDGIGADRTMELTIENISVLYRHALLARKLGRSLPAFFTLVRLVFGSGRAALTTLDEILQLAEEGGEVEDLPFSVAELGWLGLDEERETLAFQMAYEQLERFRTELPEMDQDGLDFTLGNVYRWTQEASEQLLPLAGVTLEALQEAATRSDGTLRDLIEQLERWHVLKENLEMEAEQLRFIRENPALFGDSATPSLPLLRRLAIYRSVTSQEHVELEAAHPVLLAFGSDMTEDETRGLATLLESEPALVASLLAVLDLPTQTLEAVAQVQRAIAVCEEIGVNGTALDQIAASGYATLQEGRDAMRGALQAKYPDEEKRRKLLEPYDNEMLGLRRNGLVDFLLSPAFTETEPDIQLRDTLDLYRFFLIDPEMDGCARTSWVLAGISSLQLYVHRCVMNLEQNSDDSSVRVHVPPSAVPRQEWAWRKNYRVWEANRKIFLYPENYLDPDLRDDKTPFFEELEDELLQQEITAESAEIAYKNYLDKFLKVANMKHAGAYREAEDRPLYLVAHTLEDPPRYHYRTLTPSPARDGQGVWSPWHSVDVAIDTPVVSPIVHQGKLYLFWIETHTRSQRDFEGGSSRFKGFHHNINLRYSHLTTSGRWNSPTTVAFRNVRDWKTFPGAGDVLVDTVTGSLIYQTTYGEGRIYDVELEEYTLKGHEWDRIYPRVTREGLRFYYRGSIGLDGEATPESYFHKISFPHKTIVQTGESFTGLIGGFGARLYLAKTEQAEDRREGGLVEVVHEALSPSDYSILAINSGQYDFITSIETDSFLLEPLSGSSPHVFSARRLGTTVAEDLGAMPHEQGLDAMLSVETQLEHSESTELWGGSEVVQFEPEPRHIDFEGACGTYYRELYFHIPFLIANHLNANQKFAEAQQWYHYIFDPTAQESSLDEQPEDRNWRYAPFRFQDIETLQEILTDEAALTQYRTNPFNPWAVARLRLGAYRKAVVMKYIDNLLDWGDYLFTQDTYESINEATLLYMTALDILGERPAELGPCSVPESITYEEVAEELEGESAFVVLENLMPTLRPEVTRELSEGIYRHDGTFRVDPNYQALEKSVGDFLEAQGIQIMAPTRDGNATNGVVAESPSASRSRSRSAGPFIAGMSWARPVFCVPANEHLLAYWDRVEDRLFKIRNCMNIRGMRRSLALFEPPIDPMLLARAKAAGLALEDVLHPAAQRPLYRFNVLIEKARGMTATVQNFGSALLSALEKKDAEELILMRATHEQNVLNLTRQVKEKQIQEAQWQRKSLEESQTNINNRITYYTSLIETGLTEWERTQQIALHTATVFTVHESVHRILSAVFHLIPEIGSPFAMKYGGRQVGDSFGAVAEGFSAQARQMSAISSSAGLEAGNKRRGEEWIFQLETAEQELQQIAQQIEAAKLREEIAERDLEIYEKNIEQSQEQFEFIRDKFTRLGLYNWMAQHLTRLYRQAYLLAYDVAKQAERAYQFERGDDESVFIEPTHWEQDKAGLLAGEHLMLQLQQLEQTDLATNEREREMTKHISLAMLNPEELIRLRETGSCDIHIPEVVFDLDFPGQYRRRIKSVSVTIPCVTGPYTNVNATLRLESSRVRTSIERTSEENYGYNPAGDDRFGVDPVPQQAISTSTAQSDSGLFELNFRDERYLPFEGAGAVSTWRLELSGRWLVDTDGDGRPDVVDLSQFDFDTISDVIFHISYTAREANDDGTFKNAVIRGLQAALNTWIDGNLAGRHTPLTRVISLRQEFSSQLHRFLYPSAEDTVHETLLAVEDRHFPHFLRDYFHREAVTIIEAHVVIKPNEKGNYRHFDGHRLQFARAPLSAPATPSSGEPLTVGMDMGGLPVATFSSLSGLPTGDWVLTLDPTTLPDELAIEVNGQPRLDPEGVEDIYLVVRYAVGSAS